MKYTIKKDHADIKKQIKRWERATFVLAECLYLDEPVTKEQKDFMANKLETISHEMMAINI